MKTILLIVCCLALGACSKGVFSDASIKYGNPETGKWETIPAVVYVKKGEIKAVIVEQ